ncbi:hypothetical protein E2C01_049018 [Portunus trituberculatus]|uniref:Uncharacterized protein n=1 Tax=Portunus trituberculatus TaxID=210409 RepID=A0A5B7GEW9_PORTR|nr:hypothetical protein [Portunus trituberculatus]
MEEYSSETIVQIMNLTPCNEDPRKWKCLWRFASGIFGDLRSYYADFPWNDYYFHVRDPSLCAEGITEVIVSSMEVYIPHFYFLNLNLLNLGLT